MRIFPHVSYSLLASLQKGDDLSEVVMKIARSLCVDMIHYDVSDATPSLQLEDLNGLRKHCHLPFDVHLSVSDPISQIKNIYMRKDDFFSIHIENNLDLEQVLKLKEQIGCNFGMAINQETSPDLLLPFKKIMDYVLVMAAQPGVSGGKFNVRTLEKIQVIQKILPDVRIHVDGGIDNNTATLARDLGVDVLISGSYILKSDSLSDQVASLVGSNLSQSVICFMRKDNELPIIDAFASISTAALVIDEKRIGCVCVIDDNGEFLGLITDTDIRRFVINMGNVGVARAKDVMNVHPYTITGNSLMAQIIRDMEDKGFFYTVVPVLDKDNVGSSKIQVGRQNS